MRVSVAMATYNGERFLADQLASIAAQALAPHELVVCDDGSTDRTREIVRDFAAGAPFAVDLHVNEHRLGFGDNFLRAASLCKGDAIAFSDQDDVWLDTKLERCAGALSAAGAQLVIHSSQVVDEQTRPTGRSWPAAAPALGPAGIDPFFMPAGFAFLFRSDLLRLADTGERPRSRFGYERMTHDEWVYFLATAAGSAVFLPERLALHRVHGANTAGLPAKGARTAVAVAAATGEETYIEHAALAVEYAEFLRRSSVGDDRLRDRFQRSAAAYDRLAQIWKTRAALHRAGARPPERLAALGRLLRDGAYTPRRRGGLGRRSLAKDVLAAVAGRRAVSRPI